jgi:hypothetical protein
MLQLSLLIDHICADLKIVTIVCHMNAHVSLDGFDLDRSHCIAISFSSKNHPWQFRP